MSAMSDLFSKPGGGYPPSGGPDGERRRQGAVYFAFKPEPETADQIIALGSYLRAKHALKSDVSPAVLHATVCPIGEVPGLPDERVEAARKIAGGMDGKPLELILDRVRTHPNGQDKAPVVAFCSDGAPRMELFRHALTGDLRRAGFVIGRKLPEPHVTLFYDRCNVDKEEITPIRWIVRDFVLVHSIRGEGRHVVLGQWTLRG